MELDRNEQTHDSWKIFLISLRPPQPGEYSIFFGVGEQVDTDEDLQCQLHLYLRSHLVTCFFADIIFSVLVLRTPLQSTLTRRITNYPSNVFFGLSQYECLLTVHIYMSSPDIFTLGCPIRSENPTNSHI